jgi:hypothetical protein
MRKFNYQRLENDKNILWQFSSSFHFFPLFIIIAVVFDVVDGNLILDGKK